MAPGEAAASGEAATSVTGAATAAYTKRASRLKPPTTARGTPDGDAEAAAGVLLDDTCSDAEAVASPDGVAVAAADDAVADADPALPSVALAVADALTPAAAPELPLGDADTLAAAPLEEALALGCSEKLGVPAAALALPSTPAAAEVAACGSADAVASCTALSMPAASRRMASACARRSYTSCT